MKEDLKNKVSGVMETVMNFFKCISICHDCIATKHKTTGHLCYNGPSVDEVALLHMTQDVELAYFNHRDSKHYGLKVEG